jgi:NhaB family Na+:H+ antiporter
MQQGLLGALGKNFLGAAPKWYKTTIIAFLILNPVLFFMNPFIAGWVLIAEFIFTLAMALSCYPLPAGGLLAIEAVALGMTNPSNVYHEVMNNLPVILLLMFMVAGIYFMKEFILFIFSRLIVKIKSKTMFSLAFCFMAAFMSAFLDALTVIAIIIAVAYGCYAIFHKVIALTAETPMSGTDTGIQSASAQDLNQFRGFLRNVLMHAAVGTALGGATTLVGEPQNLLIGQVMGWHFGEFFMQCKPVSIPVLITGLFICVFLEKTKTFGYGYQLPDSVRKVLEDDVRQKNEALDSATKARLIIQAIGAVLLIICLALHLAEVGLIGLMIIILLTSFTGKISEHNFGPAFEEGLPFTALWIVFFTVVAVIHDQHLFAPVITAILSVEGQGQLLAFFAANGLLSMISDNVFVATVYITEVQAAFNSGALDASAQVAGVTSQEWFDKLAVAVNMGSNVPSVATPNGQAAFLFLLTSSLAPLIKLSYIEMFKLALPYTIGMTTAGLLATYYLL